MIRRIISLQTLRAGIPTNHVAVRIQLEDRILLDVFDEQAKTFFTVPEDAFHMLAISDIFKGDAEAVIGKGKGSHGVNSLSSVSSLYDTSPKSRACPARSVASNCPGICVFKSLGKWPALAKQ